jgi:hypothetical protein
VFNFDETGLFFRMNPSQTLATKSMHEKKKDKAIELCANMDGSFKPAPLVINKSKTPRCIKKHNFSKLLQFKKRV